MRMRVYRTETTPRVLKIRLLTNREGNEANQVVSALPRKFLNMTKKPRYR